MDVFGKVTLTKTLKEHVVKLWYKIRYHLLRDIWQGLGSMTVDIGGPRIGDFLRY